MLFTPTKEQVEKIPLLAAKMLAGGLDEHFVKNVSELAEFDGGVYDLLELYDEGPEEDRHNVVSDLKDALADYWRV